MNWAAIADAVLSAGLATRLTRFVVIEELGEWVIRDPARRWADRHEPPSLIGGSHWRHQAITAVDCPFCTGTWLHLGAQAINATLPPRGRIRTAWRVLTISQTAAYVLGHLGARLGDAGYADD